jgi:beta-N-acetylhexosaminidase
VNRLFLLAGMLAPALFAFSQPAPVKGPEFLDTQSRWVDSVFNSLTPDQRLGQLFMVAAYSNQDMKHVREIRELVTDHHVGGLIWMQGGPVRQGKLANYYQSVAKVPLLYSIDGEWGLAMRLDSTTRYPRQMTLGAIRDDSLIYKMGRQIARECKRIGLHVNFAPVADVNNNPLNPVIGTRSFGEDKTRVAIKSYMYMQGMQDERVMANGKHFPGHGDTDSDSHHTLPFMPQSRGRLDTLELYPFRYLFDRGLASIMVAHLSIPALDTAKHLPSTLSPKVVTKLLKEDLGFKGLVFTDALSMKGVTKYFPAGVIELMALTAGNDVLLFCEDVPKAVSEIRKAISEGRFTQEAIDEKCRRILQAKYWCGLDRKQEIVTRNLSREITYPEGEQLVEKLSAAAITMLKNENGFLPLSGCDTLRVAEVSLGIEEPNQLGIALREHCYVEHIGLPHDAGKEAIAKALARIAEAQVVVLQINKATAKSDNHYGIGEQSLKLAATIAAKKPTVLAVMTNPYILNSIKDLSPYKAVIVGYEYLPALERAAAKAIAGINPVSGQLPVTCGGFKCGAGSVIDVAPRLAADVSPDNRFRRVDSVAMAGIAESAYPGCQIVAMKDGKLIYQKAFGAQTYNRDSRPVDNGTLYDLASITKIAASSMALMKLATEGKFDYTKTLGDYLPQLAGTNKEKLAIDDVLTHQAGLTPWIPFYLRTLEKNGDYKPGYYSKEKSDEFPFPVARRLYATKAIKDTIYSRIITSKLENPGKYLYSDLGYYFMHQIIEQLSGKPLEEYVQDLYFKTGIGLTYRPLNYFSKLQIAPTENDEKFRKQIVHGYVHDPGAALLGGIGGHAGLFGNALEVAKMMQLFLNKGEINGVRLLDSNVVKEFTSCRKCPDNRRGLCFDRPEPDLTKDSPVTSECSMESFGHSGFTGTFAWADPKNNLVVVFLSNRVFPTAESNKLTRLGIRSQIHKAFYDALKIAE